MHKLGVGVVVVVVAGHVAPLLEEMHTTFCLKM